MSTRVADRVDGWEQRSVSDGYRGLQDLADADFSGVVRAGGAELYMTKGTVVGIEGGSIEDFEGANGTSHRAPSPALPLLAVMQARGDEVRAKYYTEETPMSEVDRTLSDGGFTGYVELSENVLSGDYYLVYHQGRSMSVAFVGNSQQLVDGDEAFETADDEVGIYEVRPVEVDAIGVPDPEPETDPEPASETGPGGGVAPATSEAGEPADGADSVGTKTATDGRDEPDGRTGKVESETTASEPRDAGAAGADASTESDERTAGDERTGASQADQPGAARDSDSQPGAAGRGNEAATESSTEPSGTSRRDAGEPGAGRGGTDTTGGATEPEPEPRTEPADGGPAGASPERAPQHEPEPEPERAPQHKPEPEPERAPQHEPEPEPDHGIRDDAPEQGATGQPRAEAETDEPAPGREPMPADDPGGETAERPAGGSGPGSEAGPTEGDGIEEAGGPAGGAGGGTRTGRRDEETGVALETRSVPSLNPARTSVEENGRGETATGAQPNPAQQTAPEQSRETAQSTAPTSETGDGRQSTAPTSETGAGREAEDGGRSAPDRDTGPPGPEQTAADRDEGTATADTGTTQETDPSEVGELREQLADREAELDRLETELAEESDRREELQAEVTDLQAERDELAAEVERLETEVERLETELERVNEEFGVATDAQQQLTPAEALEGTDLFIRYQSKNGPTLTDAHGGEGRREDVTENLRLEQHTQFDAGEVAVDGQDYGTFVRSRVEYQFVTWLVEDLLFAVRDTGGTDGLVDLYDALPEVDRAELNGTVAVRYTEDGTEQRGQETFDIVFRDRMGDPLFVADLNESRQGATEGMMERLITAAERVGGSKDTLAGAFLVTESFFEPEALEMAAGSTKGGLLSRDKRRSFVNLSRKRGYHLCLVEARNQNFHLAVPEL